MPARPPRARRASLPPAPAGTIFGSPGDGSPTAAPAGDPRFFSPAELAAAAKAKTEATARTPREVLDAFADLPLTVAGLELSPVSLGHILLLERLGNPLADESITEDTEITAGDTVSVLYVLTHELKATRRLLGQGRDSFDEAVLEFAGQVPLQQLPAISAQLARLFAVAFSTLVASQKKTVKPPTTPSAPQATASAGLSPSSIPCSPSTAGP